MVYWFGKLDSAVFKGTLRVEKILTKANSAYSKDVLTILKFKNNKCVC